MAFNDEILTRAGSAWDDPACLDQGVFDGAQGDDLRRLACEKLNEEFGDADTIVIKDPRICRFYPFWREALMGGGYEPFVILPLRDPAEVAASLAARNGMSMADGLKLWRAYVTDAEQATRGHPRKTITWRHLLEDWRSVVSSISATSGVVLVGDERKVDSFLTPHLSKFSSAQILPIDKEYRSIYDKLRGEGPVNL